MTTGKRGVSTEHSSFADGSQRQRGIWLAVDVVALLALLGLVSLAFYPVYGTPWLFVTVLGFGAVGLGIAVLSALRRLNTIVTGGIALAAWFLFGGLLAMPSSTVAAVVPTPRTLFGLLVGPVTAWRDMLTLDPPIGETFNLLTVPGLVALLAGLLGGLISLRSRAPMLAWVPAAFGYLIGVIVGSQVAFHPVPVGVAFFLIVLLWTSYRRAVVRGSLATGTSSRLKPLRALLGVAVLAVAGALAVALVPAIAGAGDRDNLRAAMEPPIDLEQYASPLQAYRANITDHREDTLLTVAGAQENEVLRVATLDKYDGLSYTVSSLDDEAVEATTFTRVGQWIADDTEGTDRSLSVTVEDYSGVWVPTLGRTTGVEFDGERRIALSENFYYNRSSATGLDTARLERGDHYLLQARVPEQPSVEEIRAAEAGVFELPEMVNVPEEIAAKAKTWAGTQPTAGAAALAIEAELRKGYFSHGQLDQKEALSLPGHSERRLITLLTADSMVGDHEQYAVAMALMARSLDIPARVIYGYEVGASQTISGAQVGAWPELYLKDLGWVTFRPTPDEDRVLPEVLPPQPPEQQPFVENPPPPPMRPEVPPPDDQLPIEQAASPDDEQQIDWARVGAVALLTGIPLLTIVAPIVLIIGLKLRRRARRRGDPVVANRIAGAWSELVDRARDVGRSPSASATRSEQAEGFKEDFPNLRDNSDPVGLAKEADWLVFAPGDPSEGRAKEYWTSAASVQRGMRRSTNWLRWLASYLSTKSFRRIR